MERDPVKVEFFHGMVRRGDDRVKTGAHLTQREVQDDRVRNEERCRCDVNRQNPRIRGMVGGRVELQLYDTELAICN